MGKRLSEAEKSAREKARKAATAKRAAEREIARKKREAQREKNKRIKAAEAARVKKVRAAERAKAKKIKAAETASRRAEEAKLRSIGFRKRRGNSAMYRSGDYLTPKAVYNAKGKRMPARYGHGKIGPAAPRKKKVSA